MATQDDLVVPHRPHVRIGSVERPQRGCHLTGRNGLTVDLDGEIVVSGPGRDVRVVVERGEGLWGDHILRAQGDSSSSIHTVQDVTPTCAARC